MLGHLLSFCLKRGIPYQETYLSMFDNVCLSIMVVFKNNVRLKLNLNLKFSCENSIIPSSVPNELLNLTQVEEMLIAHALPIMRIYMKASGQHVYPGHCINLQQNVTELCNIFVTVKGKDNTFKDATVPKLKVHNSLV